MHASVSEFLYQRKKRASFSALVHWVISAWVISVFLSVCIEDTEKKEKKKKNNIFCSRNFWT